MLKGRSARATCAKCKETLHSCDEIGPILCIHCDGDLAARQLRKEAGLD